LREDIRERQEDEVACVAVFVEAVSAELDHVRIIVWAAMAAFNGARTGQHRWPQLWVNHGGPRRRVLGTLVRLLILPVDFVAPTHRVIAPRSTIAAPAFKRLVRMEAARSVAYLKLDLPQAIDSSPQAPDAPLDATDRLSCKHPLRLLDRRHPRPGAPRAPKTDRRLEFVPRPAHDLRASIRSGGAAPGNLCVGSLRAFD
jgi:hypothetical protein